MMPDAEDAFTPSTSGQEERRQKERGRKIKKVEEIAEGTHRTSLDQRQNVQKINMTKQTALPEK